MPDKKLIYAAPSSSSTAKDFKSSALFDQVEQTLKADGANIVKKMKGVFCFKVKGAGGKEGVWIVDVKNGSGAVKFNATDKADTTVIMSDDDMVNLMTGKLNPQTAFFQGKLKITGNMGLAMKLKDIMPNSSSKM